MIRLMDLLLNPLWMKKVSLNERGRCRTPININFCFYQCAEIRKSKVRKAERFIPKNYFSAFGCRTKSQRKTFTEGSEKRLTWVFFIKDTKELYGKTGNTSGYNF
jgi:hypothetical protein